MVCELALPLALMQLRHLNWSTFIFGRQGLCAKSCVEPGEYQAHFCSLVITVRRNFSPINLSEAAPLTFFPVGLRRRVVLTPEIPFRNGPELDG